MLGDLRLMVPSLPPADVGTEQVVIGAVLDGIANYADLRDTLSSGDLYDPRHRLIWATIGAVSSKGKQPAAPEVAAELHASGHLDAAGGSTYLLSLLNAPAVGDVRSLALRVAELSRKRRALAIIDDAAAHLRNGITDVGASLRSVAAQLTAVSGAEQVTREPTEPPTASDPLRGLASLSRVAVLGRARLRELASIPVQYVWQDLVVAGTIVGIASPPANGKTTLLFLILAARAGASVPMVLLGRLLQPAPAGTWVVLIEGEHGESSAARKLVASFELLGLDDSGLDRIILVARKAVTLGSPEWEDVTTLVKHGLVSDIALDTVARVAPANADNEAEQVAIFDRVARTIEQAPEGSQPTVWALMHTRKGEASELDDVSGSTQRTGQADSVFMLRASKTDGRVDEVKVTFLKLRETPDEYPEPATFAIVRTVNGRRELHQGAASAPADERPLEERILDQLELQPRTKSWLSDHLKKNKADIDDALTNLFSVRRIRSCQVKIGGRQYKAFEPWTNAGQAPDRVFEL